MIGKIGAGWSPLRYGWFGLPLPFHGCSKLMSPRSHSCGSAGHLEFLVLLCQRSSTHHSVPLNGLLTLSSPCRPHGNRAGSQGTALHTVHFVTEIIQHQSVVPELHGHVCLPLHLGTSVSTKEAETKGFTSHSAGQVSSRTASLSHQLSPLKQMSLI